MFSNLGSRSNFFRTHFFFGGGPNLEFFLSNFTFFIFRKSQEVSNPYLTLLKSANENNRVKTGK